MGEVAAGGAVAVPGWGIYVRLGSWEGHGGGLRGIVCLPEVVVEVVRAGFVGLVGEDYTGPAVVVLAGRVLDEALLRWAVRHVGRGAWGRVAVGVGDQDVFVAVRTGALSSRQCGSAKTSLES